MALEQENIGRAKDLVCAGLAYQEQLSIDNNVALAWELTLEPPPIAVRRGTVNGLPIPYSRKFPKNTRTVQPEMQFAQLCPPEALQAVLSAQENWRTHQTNAEKIRASEE